MSLSINDYQTASAEWQNYKNAYNIAGQSLANVITTGTVVYNDPSFRAMFPNSFVAYQQYLVLLQTAINTFISTLPVEPTLNG